MTEELENVDLASPPEEKKEEKKEEKAKEDKTLADVLAEFADAPDAPQLEAWKQTHGEVLCSGLSETELFVFRTVTRAEWTNLQAHIAQSTEQVSALEIETKIVETCVLWASPPGVDSLEKKAGTYSTLHEQILQASNFVNPAYAAQFVVKL